MEFWIVLIRDIVRWEFTAVLKLWMRFTMNKNLYIIITQNIVGTVGIAKGWYLYIYISHSSKYIFIDLPVFRRFVFTWSRWIIREWIPWKNWANKRKFVLIFIFIYLLYICLAEKVVKGLAMTASWLKTSPPSWDHLWLCQNTLGHVFNRPHTTVGILSKLTPAWLSLFNYWSQEYFINIFVASDSVKFVSKSERGREIRRYYNDSIVYSFYLPPYVFALVW